MVFDPRKTHLGAGVYVERTMSSGVIISQVKDIEVMGDEKYPYVYLNYDMYKALQFWIATQDK